MDSLCLGNKGLQIELPMIDWNYLLSQFKIRGEIRPTSDDELSVAEEEMGFVLPDSYKAFLKVFGPGTMNNGHEFYGPSGARTIQKHNRAFIECAEDYEDSIAEGARFFGSATGIDGFYWNVNEVTAPSCHEYRIYVFNRDDVYFMEDYFEEFMIHRVLSGDDGLSRGGGYLVMEFTPGR